MQAILSRVVLAWLGLIGWLLRAVWLDNDTREEGEGRVNIEDVKETTMYVFQRSIRWYSR